MQYLERDLQEALAVRRNNHATDEGNSDIDDVVDESNGSEEGRDFVLVTDPYSEQEALLSYAAGCVFGRWDIRLGLNTSLAPKLSGPFDPLPVCPPGMLVNPDGLPVTTGYKVSGVILW